MEEANENTSEPSVDAPVNTPEKSTEDKESNKDEEDVGINNDTDSGLDTVNNHEDGSNETVEKQPRNVETESLSAEEKAQRMEDEYHALGLKSCIEEEKGDKIPISLRYIMGKCTFICPTEIVAFSERVEEFRAINCEVVAVSTDSHHSHLAWCPNCPFTTSDEKLFINHAPFCTKKPGPKEGQIVLKFSDGTYTCTACNLTWTLKPEFCEHVVCHISHEPYVCLTCKQNFNSRVLIEHHAKKEHPFGGSRCGLRGMKRGKQFVEELEQNGSLTLFGKLNIQKTPRNSVTNTQFQGIVTTATSSSVSLVTTAPTLLVQNNLGNQSVGTINQVQAAIQTSSPILSASKEIQSSGSVVAVQSVDMGKVTSNRPDLKDLASKVRPILQKLQQKMSPPKTSSVQDVVQTSKSTDVGMKSSVDTVLSSSDKSQPEKDVASMFGVVNKETGLLEQAPIPTRIQAIVPKQTNQSQVEVSIKNDKTPYQVRAITEYTTSCENVTSTAAPAVISSTPVYLIPIGPVIRPVQPNTNLATGSVPHNKATQQKTQTVNDILRQNHGNVQMDKTGASVNLQPTVNRAIPQLLIPNQQNQLLFVNNSVPTSQQNQPQNIVVGGSNAIPVSPSRTGHTSAILPPAVPQLMIPNQQNQLLLLNQPGPSSKQQGAVLVPASTSSTSAQPMLLTMQTASNTQNKNVSLTSQQNILIGGQNPLAVSPQTSHMVLIPTSTPSTSAQTMLLTMPAASNTQNKNIASDKDLLTQPSNSKNQLSGNINTMVEGSSGTTRMIYTPSTTLNGNPQTNKPSSLHLVDILHKQNKQPIYPLKSPIPTTEPPPYKDSIPMIQQEKGNRSDPNSRFLFRIKPGNGFVCEACRKFTKDEMTFRNHIWNHFHSDQKACQSCTKDYILKRQVNRCMLVNSIVCNLIKRSAMEYKKMVSLLSTNEVISISDDEEEHAEDKKKAGSGTEVIFVEDDDGTQNGLQIQIASTASISEEDYNSEDHSQKKDLAEITERDNEINMDTLEQGTSSNTDAKGMSETVQNSTDRNGATTEKGQSKATEVTSHDLHKGKLTSTIQKGPSTSHRNSQDEGYENEKEEGATLVNNSSKEKNNGAVQSHHLGQGESANYQQTQEKNAKDLDMYEQIEDQIVARDHSSAFYMCGYEHCSFTASKLLKYKTHLRTNHMNEYNYVCSHCGVKDYNEDGHIRHLHTHASAKSFALYKCPVRMCSYKSNLLQYYICHLNAHKAEEMNLRCVYCNKEFPTTEELQRHFKLNILKFVNCSYCSFKFANRRLVTDHLKNVHPDKIRMVTVTSQIVCLEREINFYTPPPAKASSNQENDAGKSMESINIPAILEQIQKESSPKSKSETVTKETPRNPTSSEEEKTVVDQPQTSAQSNVKVKKAKGKNVGPKSLLCSHCNYLSYNMNLHNRHVELHNDDPDRSKRFVCNLCPYSTDSLSSFKNHSANHLGRTELKTFDCTVCAFNTNLKSHIMDHLQDNHDGAGFYTIANETVISTEHTCKYCDFKSRQAEQVSQHEKLNHEGGATEGMSNGVDEGTSKQETTSVAKSSVKENTKRLKYHCEYCDSEFKHKAQLYGHIQDEHNDIKDGKFTFYKCKYCSLGSTRKEMIVSHIEKEHTGKDIRILRKVEIVKGKPVEESEGTNVQNDKEDSGGETSQTEEVVIPDGNVFRSQFRCPKCSFTTLMRLHAIRHIKEHPNLKPIREKGSESRKTARKSTSKVQSPEKCSVKAQSTLIQHAELKENPFTAVKAAVDKMKHSEKASKETYVLGEDDLHAVLKPCFTPIEKDFKFKCKICNQIIMKKFVLHRHVLEHLKVVFFKCQYCPEGTVEKSLLFGHIQKSHPQKALLYHQLGVCDVDELIAERIAEQFQTNNEQKDKTACREKSEQSLPSSSSLKRKMSATSADKNSCKLKINSAKNKGVQKAVPKFKCTYPNCRYTSGKQLIMERHIIYHSDSTKDAHCTICDYRNNRVNTIKHVYNRHKGVPSAKAVVKIEETDTVSDQSEIQNSRESSVDSTSSVLSYKDGKFVKNTKGQKIKVESLTVSKKSGSVYEMRKILKCKECGLKRESTSSMYKHFNTTKCKRPPYQCSVCSFQRYTKIDILRHAKIRHPGIKMDLTPLPLSSKIARLKIPVKQDFTEYDAPVKKENQDGDITENASTSSLTSPQTNSKEDVVCGLCSTFKCESIMRLQHHINTIHDGVQLQCQECSYKTPLIKHMINHCTNVHLQKQARYGTLAAEAKPDKAEFNLKSPERILFPCVKCDLIVQDRGKLRCHYFCHLSYKPYVCVTCNARFGIIYHLNKHARKAHPNKPIKYKYDKITEKEIKADRLVEATNKKRLKLIKVKEELEKTPIKGNKRKHEESDDEEDTTTKKMKLSDAKDTMLDKTTSDSDYSSPIKYKVCRDDNGKRVFKCCQCSFTAEESSTLKKHLSTHMTRLFKCCYCSFSSKIRSKAFRHCRTQHTNQKVKIIDRKTNRVLTELQDENLESGSQQRTLLFNCIVCWRKEEALLSFEKHLASHHGFHNVNLQPKVRLSDISTKKASLETSENRSLEQSDFTEIKHVGEKSETNDTKMEENFADTYADSICNEIEELMNTEESVKSSPNKTLENNSGLESGEPLSSVRVNF